MEAFGFHTYGNQNVFYHHAIGEEMKSHHMNDDQKFFVTTQMTIEKIRLPQD
jgi:hypothetical protein